MHQQPFLARAIPALQRWWWRLWILAFIGVLGLFLLYPEGFSVEAMRAWILQFEGHVWTIYIFICFIRGIFLLPSTIFILLGAALFPDQLWAVVLISITSILASASFLYFLSEAMGIAQLLEKKYPEKLEKVKLHLNGPLGLFWMVVWSFFPLVPTDLMCYVARLVGIRYYWMLLGVFLGEMPLILLCTYGVWG